MDDVIDIRVLEPLVEGDSVTFRWQQSAPIAIQSGTALTFRYEGIDLARFSPELLCEVFLAMQLRVFRRAPGRVSLRFPQPVPQSSVAFWQAYHGAWNVEASPIAPVDKYNPWRESQTVERQYPVAVYFGGGRDSLSAACLLGEIYGRENVLLITVIATSSKDGAVRRAERYEWQMLQPARALGFPVQLIWTNLLSNIVPQPCDEGLPHLERYTAAALPVLLQHDIRYGTFCHAWIDYFTQTRPDGATNYVNARSRPDWLQWQSRHYQRALGFDYTVGNLNMALHGQFSVRILAERYPEVIGNILMCHNTSHPARRWCLNCDKCANWMRQCLSVGWNDPCFDFNALLANSRWIKKYVAGSATMNEVEPGGNLPWQRWMHSLSAHPLFCRTLFLANEEAVAGQLSRDAKRNLMLMKAFYGNDPFIALDCIPQAALDTLPSAMRVSLAEIIRQYAPIAPSFDGPIMVSGNRLDFDLTPAPGNPLASLAHLQ